MKYEDVQDGLEFADARLKRRLPASTQRKLDQLRASRGPRTKVGRLTLAAAEEKLARVMR